MSEIIGVIDYGLAGNISSIKRAVEAAGGNVEIIKTEKEINSVDKLIIPGVGSFHNAMNELENSGLIEPIQKAMMKKPTLGICLGMQILADLGFEYGKRNGLGVIHAEVKPIIVDGKVPHMGFNKIRIVKENALLNGLDGQEFYFMHSYEMVNYTNIISLTNYEGHEFVSGVHDKNIFGVQFHPEKSRNAGIQLFKNFINI